MEIKKIINSNCKKCPDYQSGKCDVNDLNCMCRFCPRNLAICISTRWCKETESPIVF